MNDSDDRKIALFTEALQLPEQERAAYLEHACEGDVELRRAVEALLQENSQVGDFLEKSASISWKQVMGEISGVEKPGDCIGGYKLLEQIGEGGCGVVFMAEQTQPVHRKVALKIIKPGMDTKSVIARFEAERQALALMDHPNIAKIFDAGATQSGRPYFVMELIRGVKFTDYCDQHSLTTEERLKLFVQVCRALQHAHQKGIIHRDIKPSNILVATTGAGVPLPVVIDFGVAKATNNQRLTDKTLFTALEMLIGTPAYMSPEQAAFTRVDVDTRTDVYSLGVLLYELLTGSTPFDTEALLESGLDEIRRVIREEDPAPPSTRLTRMKGENLTVVARHRGSEPPRLIRTIRGDLDWIVMKALEKDRTRRYETANDLALDVKRLLENEPVSARPPSRLYKFQKTVQRNGLLFIGIGVIAILLIVSLILVSASLAKERQSQRETKLVKQFLEETLKSVDPEVARGRDTTFLREILDKAAARIDTESMNQPAVAAELRSVIGTVYESTGQHGQAEEMQRAALAIRRERFGPESPEAAASLNELGITLIACGKMLEAEQVNREALQIRQRRFGNESAQVAESEDNLAHACNDNGKYKEAEVFIGEALATRRRLFGNESPEVMDSLRNLVLILGNTGRWAEAEAVAREVLALRCKKLGSQDTSVAGALNDLAWAASANGKRKEAEALEREAFALRRKVLPENYADIANSLYNLGNRLWQRGDLEDAYSLLSATASLQHKFLGNDHPSTLYTLTSLGSVSESQTNWVESEAIFRQVLASWRKEAGEDGQQTLNAMSNLGLALEGEGKWAEAETLHRAALASWRKQLGNNAPHTLYELDRLTSVLMHEKKFGETEQLLAEALTPAGAAQPSDCSLLARKLDLMGRQGRWEEAAAVASLLVERQPTEEYQYHNLAALLAITRNRPAYETLCRKILVTFTNTSNPYVDQRIAYDCLFLPDSGVDLDLVDKLADQSVSIGKSYGSDYPGMPYFQVAKAMSAYRLGRFSEAIDWADQTIKGPIANPNAHGCAILAMAHWQLGEKDVARLMLAKGESLIPKISPTHEDVDLGDSWLAWLEARISLDEAATLIQPSSDPHYNYTPLVSGGILIPEAKATSDANHSTPFHSD